jgi:GINS complex subunit 4
MASETGEGSTAGIDDYETLISTTDVELLKKAWRNEKAAPEILRFETSLIQRSRGQIQLMVFVQNPKHLVLVPEKTFLC